MAFKYLMRSQTLAIFLALSATSAMACDKPASAARIAQITATGDVQQPTRVSEGFAVEVTEKFWAAADAKQKEQLAADAACATGAETITFTRDRRVLQAYRNGKAQ
jgi:hypothetical protein